MSVSTFQGIDLDMVVRRMKYVCVCGTQSDGGSLCRSVRLLRPESQSQFFVMIFKDERFTTSFIRIVPIYSYHRLDLGRFRRDRCQTTPLYNFHCSLGINMVPRVDDNILVKEPAYLSRSSFQF